jgi:hypothetical protein
MNFIPALQKLYPPRLWALALLAMVAIIATDTVVHLRATWDLVARHPASPPPTDAASPSGYANNQHELVLPYPGIDTYHWVMQTQEMLAGGGARIRQVDYDNAPDGREVHWSSFIRWWLAALAEVDHFYTATPLPLAVEEVAPFGSVLLVVALIVAVTPLAARRFGSGPAALLAFGPIGVGPFYESFSAGRTDHHGLVALAGLLTVLFLLGGGAGWVRVERGDDPDESFLQAWLPDRPQARRWFIASGLVGGFGLWITAASIAPMLAFTGLGALLATGWLARGVAPRDAAQPDPSLWRVWGWSGAAASLFFYLLEYFPSHLGLRLEVNHPLYALAWAGGGEIIFRLSRWWGGGRLAENPRDWAWLAGGVIAVALAPALILFDSAQVFTVTDHFLWTMHNDYIEEFFGLWPFLADKLQAKNLGGLAIFIIMANPLVLLTFPMVYGACRRSFPRPARALLLVALTPALITFIQAIGQVRWVETSYALWLAALVAVATALRLHRAFRWNVFSIGAVSLFLAWALLPSPAFTIFNWEQEDWKPPPSEVEALELITRDVAQTLRARQGDAPTIIVSGPTSSTWLLYWGGFHALGTYYWENLAGMKANAEIYGASTPEQALRLLQARHATYLIVLSWVDNPDEYARLSHNLRKDQPVPDDSFVSGLTHGRYFPSWLRPVYYQLPTGNDFYKRLSVLVFEIKPDQSTPVSLTRLAQWELQLGNTVLTIKALDEAIQQDPTCLPAIITAARLDSSAQKPDVFNACVQRLRDLLPQAGSLEFDDQVDLALVFALAKDEDLARTQLEVCARAATLPGLRTLRPDALFNLLSLLRQTGLLAERPGLLFAASSLLTPTLRVQLLTQFADAAKAAKHLPEAVSLLHQALAINPDAILVLNRLAWLLGTSTDDSVRNGAEAVTMALHSREIDQGQHVNISDTLACAYAEAGDFTQASVIEQQAIALAEQAKALEVAGVLRTHLVLFQQNKPYRE